MGPRVRVPQALQPQPKQLGVQFMAVIEIGIDRNGSVFLRNSLRKDLDLAQEEQRAIDIVYEALVELGIEDADIHAEQRSANYLSVVAFGVYDFLRLKIGEKSKWFSISSFSFQKSELDELSKDARFADVKNKRQNHWKVKLESTEQLSENRDLIQKAFLATKRVYEINSTK